MNFDLKQVPFSRYGSRFAISYLEASKNIKEGLYLRYVGGGDNKISSAFRIEVTFQGEAVSFTTTATPAMVRLDAIEGYVGFCITSQQSIQIVGKGVGLRLTMDTNAYDYIVSLGGESYEVNSFTEERKFKLMPRKGQLIIDAPWKVRNCSYIIANFIPEVETLETEGIIEEYSVIPRAMEYKKEWKETLEEVEKEFEQWLQRSLQVRSEMEAGRELAAYITWSCMVAPEGKLTRPAMYMSKNWMTNIWSWDHCFNAMAQAKNQPEIAWDQIMLFIDNQHESGVFPDFINDKFVLWNCCKPPIHGWAIHWMMKRTDFITKEHIKGVYEPLGALTNWWFTYRDNDRDGIPQYNHGNDCGWDNSTVFNKGVPLESPDLAAFLIIQMDLLSEMAKILGKEEESENWRKRGDETLEKMIQHFWRQDHFIATKSGTHEVAEGDSLLLYIPIILGKRLPKEILSFLVKGLKEKGRFLTENGLSTESTSSPFYLSDGYWKGPIWAPSTMIIIDGLRSIGEDDFSKEIAEKFCKMAIKSGMAENFDALTGIGLRDKAFTWTSSVFLILGNEYC